MNRKKERFYFLIFSLSVFCLSFLFTPQTGFSQISNISYTVEQLHLLNMQTPVSFSTVGLFNFSYFPGAAPQFLNVVAQDDQGSPQWIVRNLFLPGKSSHNAQQFISPRIDLALLGVANGEEFTTILVHLTLSNEILFDPPTPGMYTTLPVTALAEDAEGEITNVPAMFPAVTPAAFYPTFINPENIAHFHYRGCAVPNIDLDDAGYPDDDLYAGDRNACGPASAANSLKWLSETYPSIDIPADLRDIMNGLSGFMERERNEGVTIEQFVKGKLNYITELGLQINVKFQSSTETSNISSGYEGGPWARNDNTGAYPTWDWLRQQIEEGEDVEIMFYWWDGEKWRGHAVVVTGVEETNNDRKTVKFKHDLHQAGVGGTRHEVEDVYSDQYGRMILRTRRAYIGHAVAESPGTPFPVEMFGFNATVEQNLVRFSWETVSETNNYGFELHRNNERIAFLDGHGTTAAPHNYSFTDTDLSEGVFNYELFQIDFNGTRAKVGDFQAIISARPGEFKLSQNYPNPFNPKTSIHFSIPQAGLVNLVVFNVLGQEVQALVYAHYKAGSHTIQFDASHLPSGVYYYRLTTADFTNMKKFILLK